MFPKPLALRVATSVPPAPESSSPIRWKVVAAAAACVALTACGGGGGGANPGPVSVPPPPAPPPAPPPPPPPPSVTNFNTAEFRRSDGPDFHGADTAWADGFTGTGEVIAVVDTGIDSDSPEFAGRLHPNSRDVVANRGIDPEDDHGTNVSLVAAGGRNNDGVLGIAFDSQILAIRADAVGSCGMDTPQDATLGCRFADSAIADGVDLAISSGATVVNLSLGGGSASAELVAAVGRAAAAGIVVVVAAGNGGDGSEPGIDPDQPDPFASSLQQAGNGNVIIVGAVDANGEISDFSNRAGDFAGSYLSARGERICCVYEDGEVFVETIDGQDFVTLFSGTSFAAPQVAGAVALLAQAFPNLTGREIVEILLDTAREAGATGADPVFGSGILDIAAAFAPQGTTTLAGTATTLALADDLALGSAAMGDALQGATFATTVLDRYGRAFDVDLGSNTRSAPQIQRLRGAVEQTGITRSASADGFALAMTVAEGQGAMGLGQSSQLRLTPNEAEGARVLAARVAARIAPDFQLGFAVSQGAKGLVGQLQGADRPAFAIAPQAGSDVGFLETSDIAFAARHTMGRWGVTVSAERGRAWLSERHDPIGVLPGQRDRRATSTFSLSADRSFGSVDTVVSVTWLSEDSTMLGALFNPAFGLGGADSVFVDGKVAHTFGLNWRIGAALRGGVTRPHGGSLLADGSQLFSEAWSIDLTRRSTFAHGDSIGFRLSQPLRISGGALAFDLPVAYDYATESAVLGRQSLSLSPEGREIMGEVAWGSPLLFGYASASAFYRHQPGHFANAPADMGALVSFNASF